jgi:hypothetical protein
MTEAEWLACSAPEKALKYLESRGIFSDRKLRLFACACCARIAGGFADPLFGSELRKYFEVAQGFADATHSLAELKQAHSELEELIEMPDGLVPYEPDEDGYVPEGEVLAEGLGVVAKGLAEALRESTWEPGESTMAFFYTSQAAWYAATVEAYRLADDDASAKVEREENAVLMKFLLEIFGNPFRPVRFDPSWRTTNVVALAQAAYDDRAFDRLPILADALEDAGCTDAEILNHCRQSAEHVRGCWVVDLLISKE